MKNKKVLLCVIIVFASIMPVVNAYQELQEPKIVYIEYISDGVYKTIGMYKSAANALINNVGKDCFQRLDRSDNPTTNEKYLLSDTKSCNADKSLFSKVLEFYKEALNAPRDEIVMDIATKSGVIMALIEDQKVLCHLSVEVNKAKNIITSLNVAVSNKQN